MTAAAPFPSPWSPPGTDGSVPSFLIADVAALTGVTPSRLRSWEQAGLLRPRRSSHAVRLYGAEDVARVRFIARSLDNPGRRGSLRRLAAQLAAGDLRPGPQDYDGLEAPRASGRGTVAERWAPTVAPSTRGASLGEPLDGDGWAVVEAVTEFVVVCGESGVPLHANGALRRALGHHGEPLPALGTLLGEGDLSLRWTARTGIPQHDVPLVLRAADGTERRMRWSVAPLLAGGKPSGAVALGRDVTAEGAQSRAREDGFVAAVQDVRSPIAAALGSLQLAHRSADALAGSGPPNAARFARLKHHLTAAEAAVREVLRATETVLDGAAAASGDLVGRMEPAAVDLVALADQAVGHARALTTRHTFALVAPPVPVVVVGDAARLRQVLANLLANAVRYAPEGGPVSVRIESTAGPPPGWPPSPPGGPGPGPAWATLRVEDTGIGIPAADLPHIFDRYRRGGGPASLTEGSGLGLFTSRAIVAAHGGCIWVERTAEAWEAPGAGRDAEAGGEAWHGTVLAVALPRSVGAGPPEGRERRAWEGGTNHGNG